MTVAFAQPMQHQPTSRTVTSAARALGRFWPSSTGGGGADRLAGWRETLGRFWPRGCVVPRPTAQKAVRRPVAARAARGATVPRRERASAPRKLRPGARPKSLGVHPLTDQERRQLAADERVLRRADVHRRRPRVYGDCEDGTGPCGWVSCRYNLYLEVDAITGAVKLNFPDKQIDELAETCALRVAGRGGHSLEQVGKLVNLTQERVSQIEESGVAKMKRGLADVRRMIVAGPDFEPA